MTKLSSKIHKGSDFENCSQTLHRHKINIAIASNMKTHSWNIAKECKTKTRP